MSWWNVAKVAATAVGSYAGSKGSGGSGGSGGTGEMESIDIGEVLKGTAKGFEGAVPSIISAEEAMRPAMQDLALSDARRALMGGDAALRTERDTAEAAVNALEAGLSKATSEIRTKISEIESTSFNVETQREEWEKTRINLQDELVKTTDLQSAFDTASATVDTDRETFKKFRQQHSALINSLTGKLKTSFLSGKQPTGELEDKYNIAKAAQSRITKYERDYGWLELQAEEAGAKDATSYLASIEEAYNRDIGILTEEIAARPEDIDTYEPYIRAETAFNEKREADLGVLANQIENLKKTGQFSDENYEVLKGEFEDAAAAVLEGSPGILDLAEYSINRQAGVGERLKEAAAKNEFRIMQELAPELVAMYRKTNEPAVKLADIVSKQAQLMIDNPDTPYTDQQEALTKLRGTLGLPPDEDSLEAKVAAEVSGFIDKESLGSPQLQKDLAAKVGSLMGGPAAGEAEKALYGAAFDEPGVRKGPSAEAQALSAFGQEQLAPGLAARGPSPAETALGVTAEGRLAAQQRAAGAGEEAIAQRGLEMLGQAQAGPSAVQQAMAGAATTGLAAPVREASETEQALRQAAQQGLVAEQRPAGVREQALTQAGLGMLGGQAPVVSPVQQAMAQAAIRDMGAGVRGASDVEQALGISALGGLGAQQRAASPEEAAMQARIGELIAGAGKLSPLEQRQIEQQIFALQQRQGRARDTGAAAAVAGRMAEARRADLGQDLTLASALLGQQDVLQQVRVQEELQRLGLGQQAATQAVGLEATRQDERLRQQAVGQQAGVSAEQIALAQAQQGIVERETGAGFLGEAERLEQARVQEQLQRQATGQQGAFSTAQLEAAREAELLEKQAQGIQAGATAEQIELARQQQEIAQTQAGAGLVSGADALQQARINELLAQQQTGAGMTATASQIEAQRQAELQAQRGAGMQAVTQAGGLTLQQTQQELSALEAAAQQERMRESQRLQGYGITAGVAQEEFRQEAAARDLERQGLTTGAAITSDLADRDFRQKAAIANILGQEQDMEARRRAENYAREQQGLATTGQAFAMQTAVAPDVAKYFGRPASQAAGMEVLGMGQQQAMYGTSPQAFDYGQGVNVAMAEQANLTALQAAQMSADAAKKAGKYSGLGNIVGSFLGTESGAGGIMDIFGGGGGSGGGISGGGGSSGGSPYYLPETSFEQWNP